MASASGDKTGFPRTFLSNLPGLLAGTLIGLAAALLLLLAGALLIHGGSLPMGRSSLLCAVCAILGTLLGGFLATGGAQHLALPTGLAAGLLTFLLLCLLGACFFPGRITGALPMLAACGAGAVSGSLLRLIRR